MSVVPDLELYFLNYGTVVTEANAFADSAMHVAQTRTCSYWICTSYCIVYEGTPATCIGSCETGRTELS